MRDHHQRLEPKDDRPCAEGGLKRDKSHEGHGKRNRPACLAPPVADGNGREGQDPQPEAPREVAMDHLAPRLPPLDGHLERRPVRADHHPAVAARPIRATEPGARESDPRAENDHRECEHRECEREPAEPTLSHQPDRPFR